MADRTTSSHIITLACLTREPENLLKENCSKIGAFYFLLMESLYNDWSLFKISASKVLPNHMKSLSKVLTGRRKIEK